jgi:uncharacterized protein DUF3313
MSALTAAPIAACWCLAAALAAGVPLAQSKTPPAEWDGLVLHESKRVNLLYLRPGASLQGYKRVLLQPLQVSFDKNWDPNRSQRSSASRLTKEDFDTIKRKLAEEFAKGSAEELAKGGYTVVTEAGADVLEVQPFIINLYITAPDKPAAGGSRTYVADSGYMTLVAELRDSETDAILARAVDHFSATRSTTFQLSSSVANMADARRAIAKWATALRAALDEANADAAPAAHK